MNHTDQIKQQMQTTKQSVVSLLGWDELYYCAFQEKIGKQYLQSYISRDPEVIDILVDNRTFWNWWKNQWFIREVQFVNICEDYPTATATINDRMKVYKTMHDPEDLSKTRYPNGIILNDSYAQMIGNVIKEIL